MSEQQSSGGDRLSRRPGIEEPRLAPHVKEGAPEWQRLYEAVSSAVRRDRIGVGGKLPEPGYAPTSTSTSTSTPTPSPADPRETEPDA